MGVNEQMQNHIIDMHKMIKVVKDKKYHADIEESIVVSIEACIENAEHHLKK